MVRPIKSWVRPMMSTAILLNLTSGALAGVAEIVGHWPQSRIGGSDLSQNLSWEGCPLLEYRVPGGELEGVVRVKPFVTQHASSSLSRCLVFAPGVRF